MSGPQFVLTLPPGVKGNALATAAAAVPMLTTTAVAPVPAASLVKAVTATSAAPMSGTEKLAIGATVTAVLVGGVWWFFLRKKKR